MYTRIQWYVKIFSRFILSVNIQDGQRNNVKKIEYSWKQESIFKKTTSVLTYLTENIFKYFSTKQDALDLHDDCSDGVKFVEETWVAVRVSPHLDMVNWATQEASEDKQQTELDNEDLEYWEDSN